VLFRAAHHSDRLEIELLRRNIPFVKYGGLKFLEAAHVKDALALLRVLENPMDEVAWFRVLQLPDGIGPTGARKVMNDLGLGGSDDPSTPLRRFLEEPVSVPMGAGDGIRELRSALDGCRDEAAMVPAAQLERLRAYLEPVIARKYDAPGPRASDLEQLAFLARGYESRGRFLAELTLDPPASTADLAGPPSLDEDYLILSTIHSAKGQEWDSVFVLSAADGCIPSDMATGTPAEIEEERRLLYVAMTRAKNFLAVVHPLRFFIRQQHRFGDRHVFTPRTRFIPDAILERFERVVPAEHAADAGAPPAPGAPRIDVAARLRATWATPATTPAAR